MKGLALSGKKCEIQFEFEPSSALMVQESFWRFYVPKYDLKVPFLLVGNVAEPKVIFDRSHVSFTQLLLGKSGRELVHLVNQESKELSFAFDSSTCYTEGRSAVVIVEPANGILAPNSRIPIQLSFTPREKRSHVFNLKCKISNASKALNLNVKGEGFAIETSLFCEDSHTGQKVEFSNTSINEIHMGEVEKNEVCYRNLYVFNTGKHLASFEWTLGSASKEAVECFSVEPAIGQVAPGDKRHCVLKYTARLEHSTIASLLLRVENGSAYHVHLDGIAVRPLLALSFTSFDFGPCFVYKAGMKLKTVILTLENRGPKELSVALMSLSANTSSVFQIDFKQSVILPGKVVPVSLIYYSLLITFE